jgi:hypothetical protein
VQTEILRNLAKFLSTEIGALVEVYSEDDPDNYDPVGKSKGAIPLKPAIYLSLEDLDLNKKDRSRLYFRMIEYVINEHFDKAFSLPMNKNLIDPKYWKRISKRVGLPDSSYLNDILSIMNDIH